MATPIENVAVLLSKPHNISATRWNSRIRRIIGTKLRGAREGFVAPRPFWPLEIFRMSATRNRFRLIPAALFDSGRVVAAFERVAVEVQARDKCSRIEALQHACDEKPELFDEYCRAFRR